MSSNEHVPVLLGPVLDGLNIREDGVYVDGTFGRGGHSSAILGLLGKSGRLIAIDRDPQALAEAPAALTDDPRFELIRSEIAELEKEMGGRNLTRNVDGLLLDLGVSSPQLDEAGRGFSFLRDGPLDMRMDPEKGVSAADWLAEVSEMDLRKILKSLVDEIDTLPLSDENELQAIRTAMAFEATGVAHYTKLRELVTDPKEKAFFGLLASMEQEHYHILKETKEYLTAHNVGYRGT